MFNGPPQNTIEHTKTFFFDKMFYYFFCTYMKNVFFIITRFFFIIIFFVLLIKSNCIQEGIFISALQENFSDEKKQKTRFFTNKKKFKKPQRYKNVLQKISWVILFFSWKCCNPSAHTDVFTKLLVPYWLYGGQINLNLLRHVISEMNITNILAPKVSIIV